jgi:hypothetical protein
MVMNPAGFGPENECAGEEQQQLETTDPFFCQRGCYIRTITSRFQLENKITGRDTQGACDYIEPLPTLSTGMRSLKKKVAAYRRVESRNLLSQKVTCHPQTVKY